MSELADDLDRLCGEAAASGVKHWQFPLSMIRSLAAALRESEEWRRDAERFAWLRDNPEHGSVPYFEDGKWHAPYLVSNAGGSGGGVGLRTYETLGDAIDAARKEGV